MTKLDLASRIELYEEIETSLREFFNLSNFCKSHCFSKKKAIIGWSRDSGDVIAPGKEGCCYNTKDNFYKFNLNADRLRIFNDFTIKFLKGFQEEQSKNISKNFVQSGTCKYHTDEGCAIEKFRTPVCNSWICEKYEKHLFNKFKISYSGSSYFSDVPHSFIQIVFKEKVDLNSIKTTLSKLKKAKERIRDYDMQDSKYKTIDFQ